MAPIITGQEGQASVEYALVMLLTALVLVFTLATGLDGALGDLITAVLDSLSP